ncbi:hypothetical protein B6A27_08995 [Anoxybacillus sp. UARK-01]|uniref:YesL family protein n=1 Tax=Anoxybacillus sp. UARK-01 TaxID=1895648 RepID=UPI0009BB048C|nr:YesL family protein [Anoxybacillus sp. UARK-01]OQM45786.1 hypothetical protein B6A27_08995 [Anoxybacillus sp. UARK-01]
MNRREDWLYSACDWIVKLAYLNLLWICFSCIGMIVAGVAPASVALFTVVRKWMMGKMDFPVFRTFFATYKKEFLPSNMIGLLLGGTAYILYIDFWFIVNAEEWLQTIFSLFFFIALIFYVITAVYIFPVYVHYQLRFRQYMKCAFFIGIANPFITLAMLTGIILLTIFFLYVPSFLPFFGASAFSLVLMSGALWSFQKNSRKSESNSSFTK